MSCPFLLAVLLQSAEPNVILVGGLPIREVAEFHRLDETVDDQRRAKPRSQPQKEHCSLPIASQRLHRRVVGHFDWASESALEVESDPAFAEVVRFDNWTVVEHGAGIANGDHIVLPAFGELLHAGNHLARSQCFPGLELPVFLLSRREHLDVRAANIDCKYFHNLTGFHFSVALFDSITDMSSFHDFTNDFAPSS